MKSAIAAQLDNHSRRSDIYNGVDCDLFSKIVKSNSVLSAIIKVDQSEGNQRCTKKAQLIEHVLKNL